MPSRSTRKRPASEPQTASWFSQHWQEAIATTVGAAVFVWQGIFEDHPNPLIIAGCLASLGVLGTKALERWLLGRINGNGKK